MEYCAGRSLENVYKQVKKHGGRTGERVLGKIACGVLGGLAYLHERKIIHRGNPFEIDGSKFRYQAFQHSNHERGKRKIM